MIKIGDFVTTSNAGYWQLIDIKPKIADEDYSYGEISYKKGDIIGKWVILKKAFTAKMKPKIEFAFEDSSWLRPVSEEILNEINKYFSEHPDYKEKFDNAEVKITPMITNCWMNLPEEKEEDFRKVLGKLPSKYTIDEFWEKLKKYKEYVSKPPSRYLLNIFTYPWDMDKKANYIYSGWELTSMNND